MKLGLVKEMLIAFCDRVGILENGMSAAEAAKKYAVGFDDISKKVQAAAGINFYILYL